MSLEEFGGEVESVYTRLEEYRRILMASESIGTVQKEFQRIFNNIEREKDGQ
jgi:negative regulator of genetic competence, sporulation and motility